MSYKSMAAEDPLVPDDGKLFEYHARRIYIEYFNHEPPKRLVEHWRECQKEAENKRKQQ